MAKEFKTIPQQIDLLKSCGLKFTDEKRAAQYLLTNNYYSIINGYSKPFLKDPDSSDKYIVGTNFDEICQLYFFHKQVKQIFFQAILNVEHHGKAIISYRFAEYTQGAKDAYLDVSSFDHTKSIEIAYLINRMNRIIKQNRHYNNNAIFHYKNSYHQVPIWGLMDFLSFGDTVALYSVLPKELRDKIAADCLSFVMDNQPTFAGNFSEDKMSSFLQNINEVRNICAHNKRLIAFKCRQDCINFKPLFIYYDRNLQIDRQSPYSVF